MVLSALIPAEFRVTKLILTEGWDACVFNQLGHPGMNCESVEEISNCPVPDHCGSYPDPAFYWLVLVLHQLGNLLPDLKRIIFDGAYVTDISDVKVFAKAAAQESEANKRKKLLDMFLGVLGAVEKVIPKNLSSVFSFGKGALEKIDELLPEDDPVAMLADALEVKLGNFLGQLTTELGQSQIDYFQHGNIATWPMPDKSLMI